MTLVTVTLAAPEPPALLTEPPPLLPTTPPPGIWLVKTRPGAPPLGVIAQKVMVQVPGVGPVPEGILAMVKVGAAGVVPIVSVRPIQPAPLRAGGAGIEAKAVMPAGSMSVKVTLVSGTTA